NDVVSEHGMGCEGNIQTIGGGLCAVVFKGMGNAEKSFGKVLLLDGGQKIKGGGGVIRVLCRELPGCGDEVFGGGDVESLAFDHLSDGLAVSQAFIGPGDKGHIQTETSFIPDAEPPLINIGPHVFAAEAL